MRTATSGSCEQRGFVGTSVPTACWTIWGLRNRRTVDGEETDDARLTDYFVTPAAIIVDAAHGRQHQRERRPLGHQNHGRQRHRPGSYRPRASHPWSRNVLSTLKYRTRSTGDSAGSQTGTNGAPTPGDHCSVRGNPPEPARAGVCHHDGGSRSEGRVGERRLTALRFVLVVRRGLWFRPVVRVLASHATATGMVHRG